MTSVFKNVKESSLKCVYLMCVPGLTLMKSQYNPFSIQSHSVILCSPYFTPAPYFESEYTFLIALWNNLCCFILPSSFIMSISKPLLSSSLVSCLPYNSELSWLVLWCSGTLGFFCPSSSIRLPLHISKSNH